MIKSMTGYGKTSYQDEKFTFDIEIKTVNSRFLDINNRMPNQLNFLEEKMNKIIQKYITRGRVDIFIRTSNKKFGKSKIVVDLDAVENMSESLHIIAQKANIIGEKAIPSLSDILSNEDVLRYETDEIDEEHLFEIIKTSLVEALELVTKMRIDEGKNLYNDLKSNIDRLSTYKNDIEKHSENIKSEIRDKLYNNIKEVLDSKIINEDRIANEIVLYADRVDINEELTRLDSHFIQFISTLDSEKTAVGKKLDFICQELLRETNTIASKSAKIEVLNITIEMKTLIEKIKEQVQNVE